MALTLPSDSYVAVTESLRKDESDLLTSAPLPARVESNPHHCYNAAHPVRKTTNPSQISIKEFMHMATRKRREMPKVPRSSPSRPATMGATAQAAVATGPAPRRGPREITPAEMHAYVKRDLARIGLFGGLVLLGMIALKFFGF